MAILTLLLQERCSLVRSVLFLQPRDGDYEAIVDFYRRTRVLEDAARVDGFISSQLHVPLEGGPALVTALWRDPESYRRWLEDPARARSAPGLGELVEGGLDAGTEGKVYEVALDQRAPGDGAGGAA
jgi:heme-degrading monooxygenase HmoA